MIVLAGYTDALRIGSNSTWGTVNIQCCMIHAGALNIKLRTPAVLRGERGQHDCGRHQLGSLYYYIL